MLIQELTRQASLDLLARTRLCRLACANGTQPYVVPVYCAYDQEHLYSFATVGHKIEWMRTNPLVCVEAAEVVSPEQWASVIVFGRYEELPDRPEWQSARRSAHTLLKRHAVWWEPAYAKTILHGTLRELVPVFYRIQLLRITGHRATPEPVAPPDTRLSTTDSEDGSMQPSATGSRYVRRSDPSDHATRAVAPKSSGRAHAEECDANWWGHCPQQRR